MKPCDQRHSATGARFSKLHLDQVRSLNPEGVFGIGPQRSLNCAQSALLPFRRSGCLMLCAFRERRPRFIPGFHYCSPYLPNPVALPRMIGV